MILKTLAGIGDAVYAFPIVKHFLKYSPVKVITRHPVIFQSLIDQNQPVEFVNNLVPTYNLSYTTRRNSEHGLYQDILHFCRLPYIPFKFEWGKDFTNFNFENIKEMARDKKICLVKEPSAGHMGKINKDFSMSPNVNEFQNWINENKDKYFYISVGEKEVIKKNIYNINANLIDKLNINDYITLCEKADVICTQIGHLAVLAQAFNKPLKVFEPERITDKRLKNMNVKKLYIKEYDNNLYL